jgi:SSS family solute:Na+ symporter
MNMHLLDWAIVLTMLIALIWAALKTRRYTTSVADFLVANRCAKRYTLAVSEGMANVGAISVIAFFEAYYQAGFSIIWWSLISLAIGIPIALSGWVVYRYRQTRALTLAQFFEMRYSRRFRIFAGITMFISGIVNFGIFPAVGARFFVYFCGLPTCEIAIFSWLSIDLMYAGVMALLLIIALFFTFVGGQIAIMVTDFLQGTLFNILLCIVIAFVMFTVPWNQVVESLSDQAPGFSMLHPFEAASTKDFNFRYYLIAAIGTLYTVRAWQGTQGYFGAAVNPHEARMGSILGAWRLSTQMGMLIMLPIAAYVIMHNAGWITAANEVNAILDKISTDPHDTIRQQATTTIVLTNLLPMGLIGAFCAIMLAAFIGNHDTYLHSWGSIFVQDVILPFRKDRLSPEAHIKLLKRSIFGVAVFIFLFSLLFPQNTSILMFFALSGTIWLGGAGAVIIGGLYWKRGTTAGAYSAIITGITVAIMGFILPYIWQAHNREFPINGQGIWLIGIICSCIMYILASLFYKTGSYNLDKLLHRGAYSDSESTAKQETIKTNRFGAIIGIDANFTKRDKLTYYLMTGWTVFWAAIFVIGTLIHIFFGTSTSSWTSFWHLYVWITFFVGLATTVWFTWGGILNLKDLFQRLGNIKRDQSDDGAVQSAGDKETDNNLLSTENK